MYIYTSCVNVNMPLELKQRNKEQPLKYNHWAYIVYICVLITNTVHEEPCSVVWQLSLS